MGKVTQVVTLLGLSILGLALVAFALYGQYQASQLYPAVHQQIGFQACIAQYKQAQVQANQPAESIIPK